ncbi:DUF202 domain-containing protein [Gangjinia marincola]|uniref:DUF202 domain-containing protein n=1 Tax=Gangjinia marincola TaxID=578463 RepID=A0ABN1MIK2_9FLAO
MIKNLNQSSISRTDILALERTKLANERTFLAYFRTFVVLLSSGFVIFKVDVLSNLTTLGYFFISTAFVLLIIGLVRFFYVRKQIRKSFY